jgi:hypothetical protein
MVLEVDQPGFELSPLLAVEVVEPGVGGGHVLSSARTIGIVPRPFEEASGECEASQGRGVAIVPRKIV